MTLKTKTILFSSLALTVLAVSFLIFHEYKKTNQKLHNTIVSLDRINHSGHEIAIEILLDLNDVKSLNTHIEQIHLIARQLKRDYSSIKSSSELVAMGMSFVRIKRIVDSLIPGQPIRKAVSEQIKNEIEKINLNVFKLKKVSETEIDRLQTKSETIILVLWSILALYILCMFLLLFKVIILPILKISGQIEQVGHGELDKIAITPRNDEIGYLADMFNQMNETRIQTEKALKQEISEHQETLEEVRVLSGFLPICSSCKNIRDDKGYWNQIEAYIENHSEAQFSHGICPDCIKKLYPEFSKRVLERMSQPKAENCEKQKALSTHTTR